WRLLPTLNIRRCDEIIGRPRPNVKVCVVEGPAPVERHDCYSMEDCYVADCARRSNLVYVLTERSRESEVITLRLAAARNVRRMLIRAEPQPVAKGVP